MNCPRHIGFLLLTLSVFVALTPHASHAAFAEYINYQGKLADDMGAIVLDDDYNMEFKLYTDLVGGSLLWTETRTGADQVPVINGLFSVMLGDVEPLSGIDFNQPLFLSINIGGTSTPSWDGEMTPRKQLTAVPAAFVAQTAFGLDATHATTTNLIATNATTTNLFASTATLTDLSAVGAVLTNVVATNATTTSLTITSALRVEGALYDGAASAGTNGYVLQTTGTGVAWVATSTLGIAGGSSNWTLSGSNVYRTTGNVGIGTSTPNSLLSIEGLSPAITLADNRVATNKQTYQIRSSAVGAGFDIFDSTQNATRLLIDSDGRLGIGTSTIPSEAKVFIWGGSSGANVDIRSSTATNPATVEVQAYDFATSFKSAYLQYNGPSAISTLLGGAVPRADSATLTFQNPTNALIYTINSAPLIFGTSNAERMRITSAGLVGIGTSTPSELLTVAGNARITGALYDSTNSAGTSGHVLQSTGTGLAWVATSTLGFASSADLSNYLTLTDWYATTTDALAEGVTNLYYTDERVGDYITGSTTLAASLNYWTEDSGNVYRATGNVGIGDASPAALLTVGSGDLFQVNSSGRVLADVGASGAGNLAYSFVGDTDTGLYQSAANEIRLQTGGSDRMTIDASGNFGVGITAPVSRIHARGSATSNSYFRMDGHNGTVQTIFGSEDNLLQGFFGTLSNHSFNIRTNNVDRVSIATDGNVGVGLTSSPVSRIHARGSATSNSYFRMDGHNGTVQSIFGSNDTSATGFFGTLSNHPFNIRTNNTERLYITAAGNIGIGDASPAALLTVGASDAFQVNSSGRVLANAGASGAGNLAYSFVGDTDTGLYRSAADTLQIQVGGTNRVTVGTDVAVVGSTATTFKVTRSTVDGNGMVEVQNGNGNYWQMGTVGALGSNPHGFSLIYNSNVTSAASFVVSTSGSVGIGTTVPSGQLELVSQNGATPSRGLTVGQYSNDTSGPSTVWRKARGTLASPQAVQAGDSLGFFGFRGYTSAGSFSTASSAYIQVSAAENFTSSALGAYMSFGVTPTGSATNAVAMTILGSGNVGIGVTNPSQKLHVDGNARITGALYDSTNSAGTSGHVLQSTGTGLAWVATSTLGFASSADLSNYLTLTDWYATTTDALAEGVTNLYYTDERVGDYITGSTTLAASLNYWTEDSGNVYRATGNVGIGTSSPATTFHVVGDSILGGTVSGSTASGGTLTIQSTTHATPGSVQLVTNAMERLNVGDLGDDTATGLKFGRNWIHNSGNVRAIQFFPIVDSTQNGMTAIALGGQVRPAAAVTNALGWAGLVQVAESQQDSTAYGLTNMHGFQFRTDQTAGYSANVTNWSVLHMAAGVKSGSGAITNYRNIWIRSSDFGATAHRAIDSEVTSGSGRYNIYAGGTAQNYFAGNVGIGVAVPTVALDVAGQVNFPSITAALGNGTLCRTTAGDVTYSAGGACIFSLRDTKHDIELFETSALDIVGRLKPSTFVFNEGDQRTRLGFIAEDSAEAHPLLGGYGEDGKLVTIDDRAFLGVIVKAIQELLVRIETIETRLAQNTPGVVESLSSFGVTITNSFARFVELVATSVSSKTLYVADSATFGSSGSPIGITLFDPAGDPYCVRIASGGSLVSRPGTCTAGSAHADAGVASSTGLVFDDGIASDAMIELMNDIEFFGRPYFNKDTAGFAMIRENSRAVEVVFDKPYLTTPIVNVTMTLTTGAENIFAEKITFAVTKSTHTGFTIVLNKSAPIDILFSWTAFAVHDPNTFFSIVGDGDASASASAPATPSAPADPEIDTTPPAEDDSAEDDVDVLDDETPEDVPDVSEDSESEVPLPEESGEVSAPEEAPADETAETSTP